MPHLNAGYNLARWLARDVNDAEDIVQDACIRALKYIDSLNRSDARAWFLTIVRHAFYDWCERNRPAEIARDDGSAIEMAVDHAAIDPEQAAVRRAESKVLADAVAELPLAFREVLDPARDGRVFLQGDCAHRRHSGRNGDVAACTCEGAAAGFAPASRDPRANIGR